MRPPMQLAGRRKLGGAVGGDEPEEDVRVLPLVGLNDAGQDQRLEGQPQRNRVEPQRTGVQASSAEEESILPLVAAITITSCVALTMLVIICVFARAGRHEWLRPKVPFKWVVEPVEPGEMPSLAVRVWLPDSSVPASFPQEAEKLPTPPQVMPPPMPKILHGKHGLVPENEDSEVWEGSHDTLKATRSPFVTRYDFGSSLGTVHLEQHWSPMRRVSSEPRMGVQCLKSESCFERPSSKQRAYSQPLQGASDIPCRRNLLRSESAFVPRARGTSMNNIHRPRRRSPPYVA
jgi:hypothetical protein